MAGQEGASERFFQLTAPLFLRILVDRSLWLKGFGPYVRSGTRYQADFAARCDSPSRAVCPIARFLSSLRRLDSGDDGNPSVQAEPESPDRSQTAELERRFPRAARHSGNVPL